MSFWPRHPAHRAAPKSWFIGVFVHDESQQPVIGATIRMIDGRTALTNNAGWVGFENVTRQQNMVDVTKDGFVPYHADFYKDTELSGTQQNICIGGSGSELDINLPPLMFAARRGTVRATGKSVSDDNGFFHPLGITFFWGLFGEKFERNRMLANLDFITKFKFDYVRILAEVGWPGEEMDPNWPDYESQLGQLLDDIYARGMRTEITIMGGGTGRDPMEVTAKVVRVVNAGRQHKVIAIEGANESFQNGPDVTTLIKMVRYVRANCPTVLVGLSTGLESSMDLAGATLTTPHIDRGGGDHKWRQVRQGWDFKDLPGVVDSNEPPGPHSSVDTNDSPLQLAMMRATGILAGGAMYVLHVGDMVGGRIDPSHNRLANIWEVPNIETIFKAVRGVDRWLPEGLENWQKFNNAWTGHPMPVDAFWSDGADHGVNRNYAAVAGNQFVMVVNGVLRNALFTVQRACHVEAVDPVSGLVMTTDLSAGQSWMLPGRDDTMTGYIVNGRFV